MFPGAHAEIYRNEAGEVLGWDYPMRAGEEPYDPDSYLSGNDDDDDDQPECPDTCPRCGLDLEYEGWPVRHQHADTGDTCPFRWATIG